MRYKLRTAAGRAIYRVRKSTVEPVIGIIKETLGFRQFSLRGLGKVAGEWCLVCLAYNWYYEQPLPQGRKNYSTVNASLPHSHAVDQGVTVFDAPSA